MENRTLTDILDALRGSSFRASFRLSHTDFSYIDKKGLTTLRSHALDFIRSRLAPAQPRNDGRQTPMKNHPVFIGQHATATCCRGCLYKWHRIAQGRRLDEKEVEFVVDLIMAWIERQMEDSIKKRSSVEQGGE